MPPFGPVKRRDLIRCLRLLGFQGPFSGCEHQFMVRGSRRVRIPNPHTNDIGRSLLAEILRQAGVDRQAWKKL